MSVISRMLLPVPEICTVFLKQSLVNGTAEPLRRWRHVDRMERRSAGLFSYIATASMSSFGRLRRGGVVDAAPVLFPKALTVLLLLAFMMSTVFGCSDDGDRSSVGRVPQSDL
jgi:hypothetical protein